MRTTIIGDECGRSKLGLQLSSTATCTITPESSSQSLTLPKTSFVLRNVTHCIVFLSTPTQNTDAILDGLIIVAHCGSPLNIQLWVIILKSTLGTDYKVNFD